MSENTDLEFYTAALGVMFEQSEDAVRDGTGNPPFSIMFDIDRCPDNALAWLGQFVGVAPETRSIFESSSDFYARQRQRIRDHLGFARGSAAAMRAAAQLYLTGSKSVFFRERDGSPYRLTVITQTSETPDPDAVLRELTRLKPAGIVLTYNHISGIDFAYLRDHYANFAALTAGYADFAAMRGV